MAKTGGSNGRTTPRILREHADKAVVFVAAHFEPQIAFVKRLPNVVDAVVKKLSKVPSWALTPDHKYLIRETRERFFYLIDHQIFYCQTLGLDPWIMNLEAHVEAMTIALSKMDVTRLTRLGFMVQVALPLEMTHYEICDLMFGSYLVDRTELSSIYGKVDDLLLQLHGSYNEMRSQTVIAPQTIEQSRANFLATPNLELFVEPKLLDTGVKEHYDRISRDCLNLRIDMSKKDVPANAVRSVLEDALDGAERVAEGTILRIKALKPEAQKSHGDDRPKD